MVQCHQRQSKNEFRQHLLPTENELLPGWRHTRILCVGKRHSRIWAQTRQLTHKSNSSQLPVKKKKKKRENSRCSTAELTLTSPTCPHTSHGAHPRPLRSVYECSAPALPLEASHDRDHSTSLGSLTFHSLCFVIPLMHSRCLSLTPFWRMLNVKRCSPTRCAFLCLVVSRFLADLFWVVQIAFIATWPCADSKVCHCLCRTYDQMSPRFQHLVQ